MAIYDEIFIYVGYPKTGSSKIRKFWIDQADVELVLARRNNPLKLALLGAPNAIAYDEDEAEVEFDRIIGQYLEQAEGRPLVLHKERLTGNFVGGALGCRTDRSSFTSFRSKCQDNDLCT